MRRHLALRERASRAFAASALAALAASTAGAASDGGTGRRAGETPAATTSTTAAGASAAGASLAAPPAAAVDTVRVKVIVEPPQKAHVFWGVKDFGVAPLEIERPRASGPLDLVLRAPGYLVVHTRAFTEHDDKLVVRLTPTSPAPASPPSSPSSSAAKAR